MELVARQADDRRDGSPAEFPLTDSQGLFVIQDRRRLPDRRKTEHGTDEFKAILSEIGSD